MSVANPGNRVPLVQFLTRKQALVQAYAYAIVRDFQTAEDVYQEVALRVAECWDELPAGDGLERWLKEATRRKALEARRKLKRQLTLSPEVLALVEPHFIERPRVNDPRKELRAVMAGCVEKLERAARTAVQARYAENRSCDEIAAELRRPVQGVYALLKRARLALAECAERAQAAQA
ncbi:MAG: sigma-70 family RNA polymerase sigma factor [Planctomycetota bacterium]|nr:sigma-70 family RNA polymerase sigma factor [Planctomycetota bacterium]